MASPLAILVAIELAILAALLFARWIIGRPSRSSAACRRCGTTTDPRVWTEPPACRACKASLGSAGAVSIRGRVRSRRLVVVALSLLATSGALALADRMIAARGMRWDAMIVPVSVDLDTLCRSPAESEAATDRLYLRCLRQRLTPPQARACADILLALADSQWSPAFEPLLELVLLRADRLPNAASEADPEAAIDWWGREESWQVVPRRVPLGSGT